MASCFPDKKLEIEVRDRRERLGGGGGLAPRLGGSALQRTGAFERADWGQPPPPGLDCALRRADAGAGGQAWRSRVGRFGVSGEMQTQPIRMMSDGAHPPPPPSAALRGGESRSQFRESAMSDSLPPLQKLARAPSRRKAGGVACAEVAPQRVCW